MTTNNAQDDKLIKILAKDRILTDVLTLAVILTVIGAICVFVVPEIMEMNNDNVVIPVIHTPLYESSDVPVVGVNDTIIISFEPKAHENNSPKTILVNDIILNNIGDRLHYVPKHIAETPGDIHVGIHIAIKMCEYIQNNYKYNTGVVILWSESGKFDHAQVWVEINNTTYIIETLYNVDNIVYTVNDHEVIWDDQYKIRFVTLKKGYEHMKRYSEGRPDPAEYPEYEYKYQTIRDIANGEYEPYSHSTDYSGTNYDGTSGYVPL